METKAAGFNRPILMMTKTKKKKTSHQIDMGAWQPSELEPNVKFLHTNDALSDRLKPIFKCYFLQPLNRRSHGRDGSLAINILPARTSGWSLCTWRLWGRVLLFINLIIIIIIILIEKWYVAEVL